MPRRKRHWAESRFTRPASEWNERLINARFNLGLNYEETKEYFLKEYGIIENDYEIIREMCDYLTSRGDL